MAVRDPRILQDVGMRFRESHSGVWLDALYGAIEDRQPAVALVTGVRFPDEAALIRSMGGRLLRVVRVTPDGSVYVSDDRDPSHRVEAEIDRLQADAVITAISGDLDGLTRSVERWLARVQSGEPPLTATQLAMLRAVPA
jgi:hypothetical protein